MRKTLASSLVAGAFLLLYSAAIVQAFESHLKLRIHKDFVQNLYTKNFDLLLSKIEKEQEKDAWLEEINAKLTDLHIGIRPVGNKKWEQIAPFETFFDESQIVLEGHDLEFQGRGMIQDPETQALEIVAFHAPMSTCQIVVSLSEQYESWGSLYPRFNIDQVHFSLDENLLSVSTFGELPLYKSHNFEKVVKKWFISQVTKRQSEFKSSLQAVEKNVWKNAPFSEKLFAGRVTLNNSLAESLRIQDDYLLASFLNEFDHQMDADFEEKLVVVNPSFSDANDFKKDVQLTFDENLVNNHFQALFNSNKAISVQETVIGWLPDTVQKYARVLSAFFNTIYFAKLFPDLSLEFGVNRMLDIKCGFSKAFLSDKLTEKHTSQIWFKEGNIVDFSFNFGCGIFVGPPPDSNILNVFQSMMGQVNEDEQPKRD